MLEILTETEETGEGKKRVASILEEQKRTLQFAMSRPQVIIMVAIKTNMRAHKCNQLFYYFEKKYVFTKKRSSPYKCLIVTDDGWLDVF